MNTHTATIPAPLNSTVPGAAKPRLRGHQLAIYNRLKQGPATNAELLAVGGVRYGARLHELRRAGVQITTTRKDDATGLVVYRMEGEGHEAD